MVYEIKRDRPPGGQERHWVTAAADGEMSDSRVDEDVGRSAQRRHEHRAQSN